MSIEENIKVLIRIRPNNSVDGKDYLSKYKDSNSIIIPSEVESKKYIFDKVADENICQEEIFQNCKYLFESFFSGYNCTIFAYGQTSSGKTYTMTGDSNNSCIGQNPGLVHQGLEYIFEKINEHSQSDCERYLLKCSFVEIYNEQLFDLLDPKGQKVQLKDNLSQGVYLDNITEKVLNNTYEALNILQKGLNSRRVGSTAMNRESSRSHAVFSIILESNVKEGDIENIRKSVLHLVDLAGSERQKDTKSDGVRLREAGSINKSLHVLGQVISAHVDIANGKLRYIRYRESKLTHLLKDSIGGNSKTLLVACIHPDIKYSSETISTLQFASNVKLIRNKAKVNMDICGNVESLTKEVLFLREQLENKNVHYPIKNSECDYDSIWKKRFIHVMVLKLCLSNEICQLKEQLSLCYATQLKQDEIIQNLKEESQMKEHKIQRIQNLTLKTKGENDDEIQKSIDFILSKFKQEEEMNMDKIKIQIYETELISLRTQLYKFQNMQSLSISEAAIVQTLFKDYNELIKLENTNGEINNVSGSKLELTKLQDELADAKITIIKQKIKNNSLSSSFKEERRKLESELASLKLVIKDNDYEKEKTAIKRRQTLLHIIKQKPESPRKFATGINCNQRKAEINTSPGFNFVEDFQCSSEMEIEVLSNDLQEAQAKNTVFQSQIGKLEYEKEEYLKDIRDLKNSLKDKDELEKSFNELKEKYNILEIDLEESRDVFKKIDCQMKEMVLEKERYFKFSNSKIQSLQVELEDVLLERDLLKNKLEITESSLELLKNECLKKPDSFLLNSCGFDEIEESTVTKNINEELTNLNKEICKANELITVLRDLESEHLAEIFDLKKRCLEQENEIRKLENNIDMIEIGKYQEVSDLSKNYQSEIIQLECHLKSAKERNEEMNINLYSMRLEIDHKLREVENMKENEIKYKASEAYIFGQIQRYSSMVDKLLTTSERFEDELNREVLLEDMNITEDVSLDSGFLDHLKRLEVKLLCCENDMRSYRDLIAETNKKISTKDYYIKELSSELQLATEQGKALKLRNDELMLCIELINSKPKLKHKTKGLFDLKSENLMNQSNINEY